MTPNWSTQLTREIRFSIPSSDDPSWQSQRSNSWAGWPLSGRVVPHLVFRVGAVGKTDPKTGLLCNVKELDRLFEGAIAPKIRETLLADAKTQLLQQVLLECILDQDLQACLAEASERLRVSWRKFEIEISPYFRVEWNVPKQLTLVTQQFEFSASHRLHSNHLSDEENERLFGKCNRIHGHGHNYVVDVTVKLPSAEQDQTQLVAEAELVQRVAECVRTEVLLPFDHRHLNLDVEEFQTLNPSVENLATVIFNRIQAALGQTSLHAVRVYETPKTWADCVAQ